MRPRRTDFVAAFLRSFAIQGSWNYRTLIGGGLAFALSPLLARIHAGDPVALGESIERHAAPFNAHPYLSPIAIGALARLEQEDEDPETLSRFRAALRAPLGALGDQAVWAGWRPVCAFGAILAHGLGVGPLTAALGFLVIYNVGHVALRAWGLRLGWRTGLSVGAALARTPLKQASTYLVPVGQALIGAVAALLIARAPGLRPEPWMAGLATGAALGGYLLPRPMAIVSLAGLFLACLIWVL